MALAELIKGNSTVLSGDQSSGTYRIFDFLGGSSLTLFFLLSTTLNPIVFYHYWKLPSTVPNILYRLLAISDFITNLARPILLAIAHFRPYSYTELLLESKPYHLFGTITARMGVTMSSAAVALLALTRAVKIQWPFYRIKKRYIIIWLSVASVYELLVVVLDLALNQDNVKFFLCSSLCISLKVFDLGENKKGYQVYQITKFAVLPMGVNALLTVVVSVWAIAALAVTIKQSRIVSNKTPPEEAKRISSLKKINEKFKGCGAIALINTTSLAMMLAIMTLAARSSDSSVFEADNVTFCQSSYSVNVVVPSVIAATNPLILILFNDDVKKKIAFYFWRNV